MKRLQAFLITFFILYALGAAPRAAAQLKLVQTIELERDVTGHFDHFGVDLKHDRLFATSASKSVLVFNIKTGEPIHHIEGIGKPAAVLYREDLNRIYVTDAEDGSLRIIDGDSYRIMKSVKLLPDADSAGYDPATKYLYIDNGGKDAKLSYEMVSIVDTTTGEKVGDIKVDGDSLEAIVLERGSPRMYVNNRAKNRVEIIDRDKRKLIGSLPITLGKVNVPMAFDETNHRLFVGCRDGHLVVFDTASGKELQALPITEGTDDLVFDPPSKRIYVASDGAADVYEQTDPDHYKFLGKVTTGPVAKTGRLVPELNRYFVAAPKHDDKQAEILVFEVQ
ncbi:MAG: YncE family protein [Acidobacteriia bacterium]|nr:YncE family protein [Terriglobia bacterium]